MSFRAAAIAELPGKTSRLISFQLGPTEDTTGQRGWRGEREIRPKQMACLFS